jgi:predicted lipid carrier protein YhbT
MLEERLASQLKNGLHMSRLDTIASRQRKTRVRDLAFAALVLVAGAISLQAVHAATQAAHVEVVHR